MSSPTFDRDGYPTDETLDAIKAWPYTDLNGLMAFVCEAWSEYGSWHEWCDVIRIATGGWSGNESIIDALLENHMAWTLLWHSSRRGGGYTFRIPAEIA